MLKRALLVISASLAIAAALSAASPRIGEPAPPFTLSTPDGCSLNLKEALAGRKGALVMFIATRCPYSNAYNERMASYAKEYDAKGVAFIGVNSNATEPAGEVARHAREHGFLFPVLKDPDNRVADQYDARRTPEVYLVDAQGILRYHGRIDDVYENPKSPKEVGSPDLRRALDALLTGRPIERPETKAFGCTIKRK